MKKYIILLIVSLFYFTNVAFTADKIALSYDFTTKSGSASEWLKNNKFETTKRTNQSFSF